ncbi:MAG: radical SAM protein, partial [Planctomycetota bacterium]|nr:radical SAM protein [Planctomycetota bacterium]
MQDKFGREIDYLRVSVTDRCNFRCRYCLPPGGFRPLLPPSEILSYEEIIEIVKSCTKLGLTKIRITGGEPLIRRNLLYFLRELLQINGIEKVALTTNGYLLDDFAQELSKTGLHSINVALNSLDRYRFKEITGVDGIRKVIAGIKHLLDLGFNNIKINTVVLRGYNEREILDFVLLTKDYPVAIRFIEYMPCGDWSPRKHSGGIEGSEIMEYIKENIGELIPIEKPLGSGPARYFSLPPTRARL